MQRQDEHQGIACTPLSSFWARLHGALPSLFRCSDTSNNNNILSRPSADDDRDVDQDYFIVSAPQVYFESNWNCNVYALDVSPDGRWLAMGCGGRNGNGALTIVDLKTRQRVQTFRFAGGYARTSIPPSHEPEIVNPEFAGPTPLGRSKWSLTISGVAWDASGKYLATCSIAGALPGPIYLFSVEPSSSSSIMLRHRYSFNLPQENFVTRLSMGICFAEEKLFVRHHRKRNWGTAVIRAIDIPKLELWAGLDTNLPHRHWSHARISVVGCKKNNETNDNQELQVVTECSIMHADDPHQHQPVIDDTRGLATAVVAEPSSTTHHTNEPDDGNFSPPRYYSPATFHHAVVPIKPSPITAMVILPSTQKKRQQMIVTGNQDGCLVAWRWDKPRWHPWTVIREEPSDKERPPNIEWRTYHPSSIVALCALQDGRFFSVDAGGDILEWHRSENSHWHVLHRRSLPVPGTPRCMAVHPSTAADGHKALLMVGVKAAQNVDRRRGFVVCYEIDLGWHLVGHVILLRKLVEQRRATTIDNIVPAQRATEWLVTKCDDELFRLVLSFLIYK